MTASLTPKQRVLPPVKPPRIILEHFDVSTYKVDQAHGYVEAACRHCGATIKGQRNVTSNFIQHMRRRHAEEYGKFSAGTQPRQKRPKLSGNPRITPLVPPPVAPVAPKPFQTTDILLETAVISSTFRSALRTPCQPMEFLSHQTSCSLFVKREDLQKGGSSVFRAAYNYISNTPIAKGGVMCRGADALSVAIAAQQHGKPCAALLKRNTSPARRRHFTAADAKLHFALDDGVQLAQTLAADQNRTLVDVAADLSAGVDHAVAGYATLGLEILQQCAHAHAIFVRAGNAPLFAALAAILHRLGQGVKLIAVVVQGVRMSEDWRAFVNDVVRVTRAEMCAAVKAVFNDCDAMLQPEGALAVAGAIRYCKDQALEHERVLCVTDWPLSDFAQMRRVADLAERVDSKQCLFEVSQRENGCSVEELMRELDSFHVSRVRYVGEWPVIVGFMLDAEKSKEGLISELAARGFGVNDISGSDGDEVDMVEWRAGSMDAGKTQAVFRVEIEESAEAVRKLLSKARANVEMERVSYRWDGSELATVLFAVCAEEWQLVNVESELMGEAISVKRLRRSDSAGMRLLGCTLGDDFERRVSEMERAAAVVPDVKEGFTMDGRVDGGGEAEGDSAAAAAGVEEAQLAEQEMQAMAAPSVAVQMVGGEGEMVAATTAAAAAAAAAVAVAAVTEGVGVGEIDGAAMAAAAVAVGAANVDGDVGGGGETAAPMGV